MIKALPYDLIYYEISRLMKGEGYVI